MLTLGDYPEEAFWPIFYKRYPSLSKLRVKDYREFAFLVLEKHFEELKNLGWHTGMNRLSVLIHNEIAAYNRERPEGEVLIERAQGVRDQMTPEGEALLLRWVSRTSKAAPTMKYADTNLDILLAALPERTYAILWRRWNGETGTDIARDVGLSRERMYQIKRPALRAIDHILGLPLSPKEQSRAEMYLCRVRLRIRSGLNSAFVAANASTMSTSEIADALRLTPATVREISMKLGLLVRRPLRMPVPTRRDRMALLPLDLIEQMMKRWGW